MHQKLQSSFRLRQWPCLCLLLSGALYLLLFKGELVILSEADSTDDDLSSVIVETQRAVPTDNIDDFGSETNLSTTSTPTEIDDDFDEEEESGLTPLNDSNPYGSFAKFPMYGEDRFCPRAKRDELGLRYKTATVFGLYNTGTNLLLQLLQNNCWGRFYSHFARITGLSKSKFQHTVHSKVDHFDRFLFKSAFNVTKHEPIMSLEYLDFAGLDPSGPFALDQLHIVMIKDPLTWIKSYCKSPYYIFALRPQWLRNKLCPLNLHLFNGTASSAEWHTVIYPNLVTLWNQYHASWMGSLQTPRSGQRTFNAPKWRTLYQYAVSKFEGENEGNRGNSAMRRPMLKMYEYIINATLNDFEGINATERALIEESQRMLTAVDVPRIMVRFEDVVLHPEEVVNRICECVGGYRTEEMLLVEGESKSHGNSRNRAQAIDAMSSQKYRMTNYGIEDVQFVANTVNWTIMNYFGYSLSTEHVHSEFQERSKAIKARLRPLDHFFEYDMLTRDQG